MNNAIAYSLQILLLIAAGALLPLLFRLTLPNIRLWYWQGLLAVCLLLPVVQPRQVSQINFRIEEGTPEASTPLKISPPKSLPVAAILIGVYASGVALRGLWLVLGLCRLRRYRKNAHDHYPVGPALLSAQRSLAVFPEIRFSHEVNSPVTFGLTQPIILLPPGFVHLDPGAQQAITVHELMHVQRGDWMYSIGEEILRSIFWFHPAIWWLLGQIQLTREQVVDRATVEFTMSREQYLEALLAIAKTKVRPDLALAPLFLRKRHLANRVADVMKEVSMSKRRIISSLATVFTLALLTARVAVWVFPLESSAQESPSDRGAGITVDTQGHKLLHGSRIDYPRAAREKRIEGTVVLQLSLGAKGEVSDARVLSGPDELRSAALSSALQWHFENETSQPTVIQASVSFKGSDLSLANITKPRMPESITPGMLKKIEFLNVSDSVREALQSRLPVHEGETLTNESFQRLSEAVRSVDEHLSIALRTDRSDNSFIVQIALGGANRTMASDSFASPVPFDPPPTVGEKRIRVGGNVQSSKLTRQPKPVYPPLAKQARIQGTVRFNALIGQDGAIKTLALVAGHPLLVEASKAAVEEWQYEPTYLNGEPVEVITVIDVNFTLTQ
jgi:TonB family protein